MRKSICVLGSTGSIGVQTLEVCKNLNIKVLGLVANKNIGLLEKQARIFKPKVVCVNDERFYKELKENLKDISIEVVSKKEGIFKVCCLECDIILNAIVGVAGFLPTVFALENRKDVALANKETLVVGGEIVKKIAKENGSLILPVDSEHSAIFQCIKGNEEKEVRKIILTASGGPFFGKSLEFLENATVCDALKHPNWNMGAKITIDSATMMNKGLELIEAVHLFNKGPKDIEIVIHPQSVLHSAVEFVDGAILGQFSKPDMKVAIQYALTYPKRVMASVERFSFVDQQNISFFRPDYEKFLCLKYCEEAIEKKGLFPTILNAANEKAVELFLKGKIKFLDINRAVKKALEIKHINEDLTIESIIKTDSYVKEYIQEYLEKNIINIKKE